MDILADMACSIINSTADPTFLYGRQVDNLDGNLPTDEDRYLAEAEAFRHPWVLSVTEAYLCRSGASFDCQVRGG